MKRKAQVGPVGAILLFVFFILIWFIWLGGFLNQMGQNAIETNGSVGLEAFFYSNLNLAVFVCMLLGVMAWMYFTRAA